jgi:hypothetical protein
VRGHERVVRFFTDRAEMFVVRGEGYGDRNEAIEAAGVQE